MAINSDEKVLGIVIAIGLVLMFATWGNAAGLLLSWGLLALTGAWYGIQKAQTFLEAHADEI